MATRPRLREALDNKGRWLRFWHRTRQRLKNIRIGTGPGGRQPWGQSTLSGIEQRRYGTYEEYVEQQRAKLLTLRPDWLAGYDTRYHQALRARLGEHGLVGPGSSVLCLAARIGTEVKAFLDLGCFAVGIDLNPGAENRYVVTGDFHALQFPDQCVDAVFTNSLDHAFDLPRLLGEIRRVLRPEGLVVLEIAAGEADGRSAGQYEATRWERIDDVLELFPAAEFEPACRSPFRSPWPGEHIVLRRRA